MTGPADPVCILPTPRHAPAAMAELELAELIGSLSHALDMTEGQPAGHCVRSCWIGMHVGRQLGLDDEALWSLYYTLLLKDLGCSSNAARICELYAADDRAFKHDFKLVGMGALDTLAFVAAKTGVHAGWGKRLSSLIHIVRNGDAIAQELIQTRCSRGADIARRLRFPESVAQAIHSLDEHHDGGGRPDGLVGDAIPLASRIALLAQVVDVFHVAGGREAARAEVHARAGRWFDPAVVAAFDAWADDDAFWKVLESGRAEQEVQALEPAAHRVPLDEDYLDAIADAFGAVVDAKSPYTAGHSARVGHYTDMLALRLGIDDDRRRWLRRAAVLHDVGKLGVSNTVLDKRGRLDSDEWIAVQRHAEFTEQILGRISHFAELARIAAAHHEKLDGTGYPRGIGASEIALETRIITTADIFDAITAERPYRGATPVDEALAIMRAHVGTAIDPVCFEALETIARAEAVTSSR
jgi:HD-GYP domain-containing protein (c-di-GMP phosphodiesterase class II)